MGSTEVGSRSALHALMAALPGEGELLLSQLQDKDVILKGDFEIHTGKLAGNQVLLAFSGLGKINAAAAAATMLASFPVSRLWMWGSAGAYPHTDVKLNDLALASEEILGDEGVATRSSWRSLDAIGIPLAKTAGGPIFNQIPVDRLELERARRLLSEWRPASAAIQIHQGPFVTVSGASGSLAQARLLADRFGALCENMEGAAVAQVCLRYQVVFLELRGLSNWAGDRNKKRWQLTKALDNCQKAVLYLLENWDSV
ncbi:MAG: futalosine hydrolase [Syntrophobacterales bacterium]|jgi:futalosine hydrolase